MRKILAVAFSVLAVFSSLAPTLAVEGQTEQSLVEAAQTENIPVQSEQGGPGEQGTPGEQGGPGGQDSSVAQEVSEESTDEMDANNKVVGDPYDEAGLLTYCSENGEVTIMSCSDAAMGELYVPAYINDEPVTAIYDYAFLYCAALTAVTLPETVTQVGENAFAYCTQLTAVAFEGEGVSLGNRAFYYCNNLTEVHFKGTAALVGKYAFGYCSGLTTVDFQKGVERIGDYAFAKCVSLASLPIQSSEKSVAIGSYTFSECTGLVNVTIPATVSSLGDRVFYNCTNLESAVLDDGIPGTQVGEGLFYNCWKLTNVHLPTSWTEIPDETFYACWKLDYTIPNHLKRIGAYAFKECTGLPDDLVIPAGVTEIGEGAFQNCKFTSIVLSEGVTEIEDYAFDDSSARLTSVTLPEGLLSIGKYAFGGNRLESLTLPSTLTYLADYAFYHRNSTDRTMWGSGTVSEIELPAALKYLGKYALDCCGAVELDELVLPEGLTYFGGSFGTVKKVVLPAALEKIEDSAFYGSGLEEAVILCPSSAFSGSNIFSGCLTSVSIPDGWTEIPAGLFQKSKLTSVIIPEGVTAIGENAFIDCNRLASVRLPSTLTVIGANAFSGTAALTGITFPDSLTELGKNAFSSSGLTSVTLPRNVETMGSGVFSSCNGLSEITLDCNISGSSIFSDCVNLITVTFGSGATAIYKSCFQGCTRLREVYLSDTIREIGESAFANCTALSSIDFPEGLESIEAFAFWNTALTTVSLPSSLIRLEPSAFGKITTLTTVHLAEGMANDAFRILQRASGEDEGGMEGYFAGRLLGSLTALSNEDAAESSAFYGCSALSEINIPKNWTYIPAKFLRGCDGPLGQIDLSAGITAIGSNAFQKATGITAITLPKGLRSIGAYALYGCTGLTELKLPAGLSEDGMGEYAIGGCPKLKKVSLPEGWTSIPEALFQGNQSIETYEIPEGVVRIGDYAFSNSALKKVSLPSTLREIGAYAFRNCALTGLELPGSVTEIGAYAFQNCAEVTHVTLPEGLTGLGEYAFSGTGLTGITVPGTVDTIGMFAFYDCDSLVSVVVEPGVSTIDGLAFGYCDSLTSVSLPDSAVNLTRTIFYGSNPGKVTVRCSAGSMAEELVKSLLYLSSNNSSALKGATFHFDSRWHVWADSYYYLDYQGMSFQIVNTAAVESTKSYQDYMKRNNISNYYAVLVGWDPSFTSLVVPDYVGGIPVTCFGSNTGTLLTAGLVSYAINSGGGRSHYSSYLQSASDSQLRSLTVGANIKTVGGDLFYLTGLEKVVLQEGVTTIGKQAFAGLTGLTSVVLPSTLVSIGEEAFIDCTSLSSVTFQEGLESIDVRAFGNTALTDVYLPASLKELNPYAFEGTNAVLHFTGSAGALRYTWIDGMTREWHTDSVLPILMEYLGVQVAQFQGAGLESQDSYFISTAAAGLNQPMDWAQNADTNIVADTAPVLEDLDVPNEVVIDAPEAPDAAEPQETPEEPEKVPEETPDTEQKVIYEAVLNVVDAIRHNPLVTAFVIAGAVLLVVLGAWHRWHVTRAEDDG